MKKLAVLAIALFVILLPAQAWGAVNHPATSTTIAAWDDRAGGQVIYEGGGYWWVGSGGGPFFACIGADWVPNPTPSYDNYYLNPYDSITFHLSVDGGPYSSEKEYLDGWSYSDPGSEGSGTILLDPDLPGAATAGQHYFYCYTSYTAHITDPSTGETDSLSWSDPTCYHAYAVDVTPPVITAQGVPDQWVRTATVTFTATDPETGIYYDEHENEYEQFVRAYPYGTLPGDQDGWQLGDQVVLDASSFPKGGPIVVECEAWNGVWGESTSKVLVNLNFGEPSQLTLNGTDLSDGLHPAIKVGGALWSAQGTLDFTASPALVADALRYRLDGGAWTTTKATGLQLPIGSGAHEVDYQGIDTTGVPVEDVQTLPFSIDSTAAVLTVNGQQSGWHNSYSLGLTWQDPDTGVPAGEVQQFKIYRDGTAEPDQWQTGSAVTLDATSLQGLGIAPFEGVLVVLVRGATNGVGLTSASQSLRLEVDTLPPQTTDSSDGAWHPQSWGLSLTPTDGGSGVQQTQYRVDGGSWQTGTSVSFANGLHSVDYYSTDYAGNAEAANSCQVKIDGVAPITQQSGADDAWHTSPVAVSFTATDATSGVAKTEYKLDGGPWVTGSGVTVTTDGDHALSYRSTDNAGNVETAKACHVKIDTSAPVTKELGAAGQWSNLAVTVTLTASDAASGVASTSYSTDGGASWQAATSLIVAAPADHSNDGVHTVLYRSVDNVGFVETAKKCTIKIDTRQPLTSVPSAAKVRRGFWANLCFRINDQPPCASKATVTIKVMTLGGRVLKVFKLGRRQVNRLLSYRFRCTLAKKTYKFRVYATDAAGNKQAVAGGNRLVVR
jgi:hypothetical protein